jgi:hypothetical protein
MVSLKYRRPILAASMGADRRRFSITQEGARMLHGMHSIAGNRLRGVRSATLRVPRPVGATQIAGEFIGTRQSPHDAEP